MTRLLVVTDGAIYPSSKEAPAQVLRHVLERLAGRGDYKIDIMFMHSSKEQDGTRKKLSDSLYVRCFNVPNGFAARMLKKFTVNCAVCGSIGSSDAVLFNTPPINFFTLPLIWAWLASKKVIYIAHGGLFTEFSPGVFGRVIGAVQRQILSILGGCFSLVICVSYDMAEKLSKFLPAINIRVIHNAVDPYNDALYRYNLTKIGAQGGEINIGYLGRLDAIKNVETLMKAFTIVDASSSGFRLIIAGRGKCEEGLKEKLVEMDLSDKVDFIGYIDEKGKEEFFRRIDILVVPSKYEPFGLVIVEAMAAGVPVIGSDIGGIREIIIDGETGKLFPSMEASRLGAEIVALSGETETMRRYATAARAKVESYFNWDRAAHEYDTLIKQITEVSGKSPSKSV